MMLVSIGWCDRLDGWLISKIEISEVGPDYAEAVSRWENEGGR